MTRQNQISNLKDHTEKIWDVIVIGGGATGLGIALDAVTRGYSTILLERSDFSTGTSSRSTKLVHGGVRYLAQGDILLVMEALRERGRMLKNAPHLTENQEFIIPVYTWFDVLLYTVGLTFYDILAGSLSLGKSYFISRSKTLSRLPNLKKDNLKGGIVYHDGQFDDSRMAIALAKSAIDNGATILNYFNAYSLIKDGEGKISGVKVHDTISGKLYDIMGRLVINATGVFADDIMKLDNPGGHKIIKPSQGVHLVIDKKFTGSESAIMIPKTSDGRVLFAIPWYDKVVVGTTDTPLETISEEPVALDEEIDFILMTAGKYFSIAPERKDILSVFAGLRPLASDPDKPQSTKEISRRHKIILSRSNLLTITGGKWTTYRRMALETIDRAIKAGLLEKRKCVTKNLVLNSRPEELLTEHLSIYGNQAYEIEKMIKDNPDLGRPISEDFSFTRAEIIWICRNEMPQTIEDVLTRRTRALLLNAKATLKIAPVVAALMADEMGFDKVWQEDQLKKWSILVKKYLC